jgi:uncharacterized membrane protein
MFTERDFARLIQRTLLAGVLLSALLIFSGFAFLLAGAGAGTALLKAGILALILTPAARVAMLVYGYWRGGEYYFALASFTVLGLLAVSLLI